jgi:hypothetical protein
MCVYQRNKSYYLFLDPVLKAVKIPSRKLSLALEIKKASTANTHHGDKHQNEDACS